MDAYRTIEHLKVQRGIVPARSETGIPTRKVCLFVRPVGKMSNRSNFFVFGTLRSIRPFFETAGETAFDGGGGDVGFCHFLSFLGHFQFLAPILADHIGAPENNPKPRIALYCVCLWPRHAAPSCVAISVFRLLPLTIPNGI